jgi:hypothetical protein
VDLRTTTTAVEQQETITKDNVPAKINAVIWRRVVDPTRSLIEVANVEDAVTQAARQGRAGADEEYRNSRKHAARDGAGGRSLSREAFAADQGRSRTRGRPVAETSRRHCLELRRMQMLTEVGAEQNTMTIVS